MNATTQTFGFTVYLADVTEATIDDGEKLAAAGCDDGTFGSCDGAAFIEFDRDAPTLHEAIESAIANIRDAGFRVSRVTSDEAEVIARVNEELQRA